MGPVKSRPGKRPPDHKVRPEAIEDTTGDWGAMPPGSRSLESWTRPAPNPDDLTFGEDGEE